MIQEPFPSATKHRNNMRLQEIKVGWRGNTKWSPWAQDING